MDKITQLNVKKMGLEDEIKSLLATDDVENIEAVKAKQAELATVKSDIAKAEEFAKMKLEQAEAAQAAVVVEDVKSFGPNSGTAKVLEDIKSIVVPQSCKSVRLKVKEFADREGMTVDDAQKALYGFGAWYAATITKQYHAVKGESAPDNWAMKWCRANGVDVSKGQQGNINSAGGFLIPTPLAGPVISLIEKFGVARQLLNRRKMSSDTLTIPRRAGTTVTAQWLTDGQNINTSQKQWDAISLTAKKLATLILMSNEVAEDAIIDLAADLAQEIAFIFSYYEDAAAFLGDGTSKYGGIVGFVPKLQSVGGSLNTPSANTAYGGVYVASSGSGSNYGSITLKDFNNTIALMPEFAFQRSSPKWLCSRQAYEAVMVSLAAAAGGNRIDTIDEGPDRRRPMFLGYPVEFSQVMPRSVAANQIPFLFGAFDLAAEFGDRTDLRIALSPDYVFEYDQIAIRGTERIDINVHDVGGSSAAATGTNPANSAGSTVAGPVVGLQTYSS